MFKKLFIGTGVTAVAGNVAGYFWAKKTFGDDGLERIIKYDMVAIPAAIEYKLLEAQCEKFHKYPILSYFYPKVSLEEEEERFSALHKKYVQPLYDLHMELGGFYYKSGQKTATNYAGVIPEIFVDHFQPFLNDIPARNSNEVRAVLEKELGKKREEVFSYWEEKPIGCASIGQVHRAVLKTSGKKVVVKVQNPDAERTFRGDVFALKSIIDIFAPQFSVAFDEIQKQFATEFDYRGECQNAIDIRKNLMKAGYTNVIVPEVFPEYCSEKVMVMEEVTPSTPLHDILNEQGERMARQKGMTKKEFLKSTELKMVEDVKKAAESGDYSIAKSISADTYDAYIKLQQGKKFAQTLTRYAYNWTLGWFLPNYDTSKDEKDDIIVPLNAARIIDELFEVHGHEIFIDGCFNADPHPGNILYANGKLALIDYGQVKRLNKKERIELSKGYLLVQAAIRVDPKLSPNIHPKIHERAVRSVANHSKSIGMNTKYNYDETLYNMSTVYLGRMDRRWFFPDNYLQWADKMQEKDPMGDISAFDYLVMVNMTSMMLRGLAEMLQQPRNTAETWAPFARKVLRENNKLKEIEDEIASWSKNLCPNTKCTCKNCSCGVSCKCNTK
jgi:aarF domain-containing kinase